VRQFDPGAARQLKDESSSDLSIGGAAIATEAFRHGLVDEYVLLLCPVLLGGGKPALPRGVRLELELVDHRGSATGSSACATRYGTLPLETHRRTCDLR
jgi:dihydrofolate reductase